MICYPYILVKSVFVDRDRTLNPMYIFTALHYKEFPIHKLKYGSIYTSQNL